MRPVAALAIVIALTCAPAGCGSPPVQNYYVLTPLAASANSSGANATAASGAAITPGTGVAVFVDPAHLPEAVDRPQMVIGAGENRVTILEQQRWAEPLRAAIPQVIALDLAHLVAGARVTTAQPMSIPDDAWRLTLDVQRFDSRPGDAVWLEIAWTMRRAGTVKSGRSAAREPLAATGYDAIAVAHSKALAAISREIAAALQP